MGLAAQTSANEAKTNDVSLVPKSKKLVSKLKNGKNYGHIPRIIIM